MKLVLIDRDGVINHDSVEYIKNAREWRPIDGSLEAIASLTHADVRVVVITNQAGLGRGLFEYSDLFAIHDKMVRMVSELGGRIDGILFCPHSPDAGCKCRKPEPGLLHQASQRLQIELSGVPFIGDSEKDLRAAVAAGASPVLVRTGNGLETEAALDGQLANTPVHADLAAAVAVLLANRSGRNAAAR